MAILLPLEPPYESDSKSRLYPPFLHLNSRRRKGRFGDPEWGKVFPLAGAEIAGAPPSAGDAPATPTRPAFCTHRCARMLVRELVWER